MKYCIRYNNKSEVLDDVQEVSINYDGQDQSLVDYLSTHSYRRTILRVHDIKAFLDNQEWRKLNAIRAQYSSCEFAVCFCVGDDLEAARPLLTSIPSVNFEWFLDSGVSDWDKLHEAASLGVSDVYITEALGFELPDVYKFCHSRNMKVRVYPNVAQSSAKLVPTIRSFFIRPEDIDAYSPYIDCLEFYGPVERQDVLLKIYRETKIWPYPLEILILGLPHTLSAAIAPNFVERLSCGKHCLRGSGCKICGHVSLLSKLAKENNLNIKYQLPH